MSDSGNKPDNQKHPCRMFAKIVYEVPSQRNEITNLSRAAMRRIERMGVGIDLHQLELVLLEALTNALLYGNLEVPSKVRDTEGEESFWRLVAAREKDSDFGCKKIILEIDCIEEALEFKVRDEGGGFDWRSYEQAIDVENVKGYHERGILLIRNYVDQLRWNDKGNEMTFVIKLGPKAIDRR